ncbi:hypothetical protein D3C74_231590 [compost metagenome]
MSRRTTRHSADVTTTGGRGDGKSAHRFTMRWNLLYVTDEAVAVIEEWPESRGI